MLLDMVALASEAEAVGGLELSIHGDAAVAAIRGWALSRGIEIKATVQHHTVNDRRWTVTVDSAQLDDRRRITAFGDWRLAEEIVPSMPVAAGGAS